MAVHPDHPELQVNIAVDGNILQEYDDQDTEPSPKKVTRYIEATTGSKFKFEWSIPSALFKNHGVRADVRIDGESIAGRVYDRSRYSRHGARDSVSSSAAYVDGKNMGQEFQFSKLDTYEETRTTDDALSQLLGMTGQVSVIFHAVHNVRLNESMENRIPSLRSYKSIPEKALKGSTVSHIASLGTLQSTATFKWYNYDYVHGEHHPFAVFYFKYRSLSALKSLCIVPRTPSPTPLEERPTEDLSAAELAELVNRYRQRETENQRLKQERSTTVKLEPTKAIDLDDDDVVVIEERSSKLSNGEVLEEFPSDEHEPSHQTVTKYVRATTDARFGIGAHLPASLFTQHGVSVTVHIDGKALRRLVISREEGQCQGFTAHLDSSRVRINGEDMERLFHFSKIRTHDTARDDHKILPQQIADVGGILVRFHAITNVRTNRTLENCQTNVSDVTSLPEKALKGSSASHKVKLDPLQPTKGPVIWSDFDWVGKNRGPFAVFHFKYRSLDALKSLLIVPRTPSPAPPVPRAKKSNIGSRPTTTHGMRTRATTRKVKENTSDGKHETGIQIKQERNADVEEDSDDLVVVEERQVKRRRLPNKDEEVTNIE